MSSLHAVPSPGRRAVTLALTGVLALLMGGCGVRLQEDAPDLPLVPRRPKMPGEEVLLGLLGDTVGLVAATSAARGEVEKACRALGLRADTVATSAKAVRYTERDQPHMIIVDERLRDNEFDALMQDIRRLDPRFGFLEVTDDVDTFEVGSWAGDSMTRVSRNALRAQLPAVLTLELAKAC